MLEIIALVFMSKKLKAIALEKGEKPGKWIAIQVITWIGLEITGGVVAIILFGEEAVLPGVLVGLAFAVCSYFIIKNHLSNMDNQGTELDEFALKEEKKLDHFR